MENCPKLNCEDSNPPVLAENLPFLEIFPASAISCPAWWGISRYFHAIKTDPHHYPREGGGGASRGWLVHRSNGLLLWGMFHLAKQVQTYAA